MDKVKKVNDRPQFADINNRKPVIKREAEESNRNLELALDARASKVIPDQKKSTIDTESVKVDITKKPTSSKVSSAEQTQVEKNAEVAKQLENQAAAMFHEKDTAVEANPKKLKKEPNKYYKPEPETLYEQEAKKRVPDSEVKTKHDASQYVDGKAKLSTSVEVNETESKPNLKLVQQQETKTESEPSGTKLVTKEKVVQERDRISSDRTAKVPDSNKREYEIANADNKELSNISSKVKQQDQPTTNVDQIVGKERGKSSIKEKQFKLEDKQEEQELELRVEDSVIEAEVKYKQPIEVKPETYKSPESQKAAPKVQHSEERVKYSSRESQDYKKNIEQENIKVSASHASKIETVAKTENLVAFAPVSYVPSANSAFEQIAIASTEVSKAAEAAIHTISTQASEQPVTRDQNIVAAEKAAEEAPPIKDIESAQRLAESVRDQVLANPQAAVQAAVGGRNVAQLVAVLQGLS